MQDAERTFAHALGDLDDALDRCVEARFLTLARAGGAGAEETEEAEDAALDERRQALDRWYDARLAYAGARLGHALEVARLEHRPTAVDD